jgi:hypothetical protein
VQRPKQARSIEANSHFLTLEIGVTRPVFAAPPERRRQVSAARGGCDQEPLPGANGEAVEIMPAGLKKL